jgi:hypothetical protein
MPTNNEVSRRAWLGAMGAAFVPWPSAVGAGAREVPRFNFVVVSDTHLGRDDKEDAAKLWAQTTMEVNKAEGEFVLHLGDLVDGRREKQYPVYLDVRKTISISRRISRRRCSFCRG